MPFSRSRSIESMTRSATSEPSRKAPDCQSIASTRVVLPWSTCATMATLRMSVRACTRCRLGGDHAVVLAPGAGQHVGAARAQPEAARAEVRAHLLDEALLERVADPCGDVAHGRVIAAGGELVEAQRSCRVQ